MKLKIKGKFSDLNEKTFTITDKDGSTIKVQKEPSFRNIGAVLLKGDTIMVSGELTTSQSTNNETVLIPEEIFKEIIL